MRSSSKTRKVGGGVALFGLALLAIIAFSPAARVTPVVMAQGATPAFEVDRLWPKPLPNHWILGSVTGMAVDGRDHIWLVHRGLDSLGRGNEAGLASSPQGSEYCCLPAPSVLEFDAAGTLLNQWGGPGQGFEWPVSPGGLAVDDKGNVWIAAAGPPEPAAAGRNATGGGGGAAGAPGGRAGGAPAGGGGRAGAPPRPQDAHVLKFSRTGEFLLQIGHAGQPGAKDSTTGLDRPAALALDASGSELYVADGGDNQRVVVFDAATGAFKRQWRGHGMDFARLSCIAVSKDRLVYVCDRKNDRLQVFNTDGTFVKDVLVSKATTGNGSVWGVTFSADPRQRFLFVADGQDEKIWILDRSTLEVVTSFGDGGRQPGEFYAVGSVAMDSKGNLYTGEGYEGKRLQKFVKK
jgi:hypothetical protein